MRIGSGLLREKRADRTSRILVTGATGFLGSHIAVRPAEGGLSRHGPGPVVEEAPGPRPDRPPGRLVRPRSGARGAGSKSLEGDILDPAGWSDADGGTARSGPVRRDRPLRFEHGFRRAQAGRDRGGEHRRAPERPRLRRPLRLPSSSTMSARPTPRDGDRDDARRTGSRRARSRTSTKRPRPAGRSWPGTSAGAKASGSTSTGRPSSTAIPGRAGPCASTPSTFRSRRPSSSATSISPTSGSGAEGRPPSWASAWRRTGRLFMPLRIEAGREGGINLVPIDHCVDAFMAVLEDGLDGGIYHIVNPRPTRIEDLVDYAKRLFRLRRARGVRAGGLRRAAEERPGDPLRFLPRGLPSLYAGPAVLRGQERRAGACARQRPRLPRVRLRRLRPVHGLRRRNGLGIEALRPIGPEAAAHGPRTEERS
ncbi:MAG: hypothetical protein MZV64_43605 [Ignavibacteriales bacterium]|nr:hypothetical protein [Ignavibacteriales bacterium]